MNELVPRIPVLATLLGAYFDPAELAETAGIFGVKLESIDPYEASPSATAWLLAAKQLVEELGHGNGYALLSAIVDQLESKNALAIARTTYERRQANEALAPKVAEVREALSRVASPGSIVLPEVTPFRAKAEIRSMLATATSDILVVDPFIGVGTLDCLLDTSQPIRLLTAEHQQAVEPGFERALAAFKSEGRTIAVRRAPMLHDRHLIFDQRCWLVGSSLKDAGKKAFHCIEVIDRAAPVGELETKWAAGQAFP